MIDPRSTRYQVNIGPDEFNLPPTDVGRYYNPNGSAMIRRPRADDDDRFNVLEDSLPDAPDYS